MQAKENGGEVCCRASFMVLLVGLWKQILLKALDGSSGSGITSPPSFHPSCKSLPSPPVSSFVSSVQPLAWTRGGAESSSTALCCMLWFHWQEPGRRAVLVSVAVSKRGVTTRCFIVVASMWASQLIYVKHKWWQYLCSGSLFVFGGKGTRTVERFNGTAWIYESSLRLNYAFPAMAVVDRDCF
jgi:hypothetical protein